MLHLSVYHLLYVSTVRILAGLFANRNRVVRKQADSFANRRNRVVYFTRQPRKQEQLKMRVLEGKPIGESLKFKPSTLTNRRQCEQSLTARQLITRTESFANRDVYPIYMYKCMYRFGTYTNVWRYVYISKCLHTSVWHIISVCMHLTHRIVYVCMHPCMRARVHVGTLACWHIRARAGVSSCTGAGTHTEVTVQCKRRKNDYPTFFSLFIFFYLLFSFSYLF